jgi:hypothetical protein
MIYVVGSPQIHFTLSHIFETADVSSNGAPPQLEHIIFTLRMANSKYEYVKDFEREDVLMRNTWIVVRIDGRGFHKYDSQCPLLFSASALLVLRLQMKGS